MTPEWDALQALVTTIKLYPVRPQITHVKGHQDRYDKKAALALNAQLNVEADDYVKFGNGPALVTTKVVPRIAGNTAQYHSTAGTVTTQFKKVLRKQCSTLEIQEYICIKRK